MSYLYPQEVVTLSKPTVSNVASVSFTSLISSNFSVYRIMCRNIIPVTNSTALLLTLSTNNGSTYLNTNYKWIYYAGESGGFAGIVNSNSASSIEISGGLSSTTSTGLSIDIDLFDLNQSTFNPKVRTFGIDDGANAASRMIWGTGTNTTTTAITAVKLAMSSGNISSGTINLYGVART